MSNFTDSANSKSIDQREHNNDASAKRVVIRGQNPDDGHFYNIAAVDNGDGTFSLSTSGGGSGSSSPDTPLSTYTYIQKDTTSSGTYKYYGYADANTDGGWAIKRITIASNLAEYVKGASDYSTNWTGRAGLSYASIWSTF